MSRTSELNQLLFGSLRNLMVVPRYQTTPVTRPESVAAHTAMTALITYVVGTWLESSGRRIDVANAVLKATVHDLEEYYTGDMIREVKHSKVDLPKIMTEIGRSALGDLETELSVSGLCDLWSHAKSPKTIEGQVVKLADFLSVVVYCDMELVSGNQHIVRGFLYVRERLVEFSNAVDDYDPLLREIAVCAADLILKRRELLGHTSADSTIFPPNWRDN